MEQLDFYLLEHSGESSRANIRGFFEGYHMVAIHSISLHFTFKNISAKNSTNIFYFSPADFLTIPDGSYSLKTFNKYLSTVPATALYRVMPSLSGLGLDVVKYANATNLAQDVGRDVQNVSTLGVLNSKINRCVAFCERIKIFSDLFNVGTRSQSGNTEKKQFVVVPIECEPTEHQMYSLNLLQQFEFKNPSVMEIFFTDMDDTILEFSQSSPAILLLDFVEGTHPRL